MLEIVTAPHRNELLLCYSSKEASICKHPHDNGQLQIVKRFFKVSTIKSILSNLIIQKIAIRPQSSKTTTTTANDVDAAEFTIAVLVNDDSIYVYECIRLNDKHTNNNKDDDNNNNNYVDAGSGFSIQLTKHIHPIEQRDLHGRQFKNHRTNDANNSEYKWFRFWFWFSFSVKKETLEHFAVSLFWCLVEFFLLNWRSVS